jgi:muramoyltetrapeptide carboxypeptidase
MELIYPSCLKEGDKIAIVSPASAVKSEYIDGACTTLRSYGLTPVVFPHAKGPSCGSYAATSEARAADLHNAFADSSIKAILCARGGYGCNHLLTSFTTEFLRNNAKWLIGFSDISVLHAMMQQAGVASIHASMAKHLATAATDNRITSGLIRALTGDDEIIYKTATHPYNRKGECCGSIRGGNLAVLSGLASTPYDILDSRFSDESAILFIEDIGESIYKVERMLIRMALSGTLHNIAGLIIGQFTEYTSDRNYMNMEDMINAILNKYDVAGIPVAFNYPIGHVDDNYSIIEGAQCELCVEDDNVTLTMRKI